MLTVNPMIEVLLAVMSGNKLNCSGLPAPPGPDIHSMSFSFDASSSQAPASSPGLFFCSGGLQFTWAPMNSISI
jgi:hypothetical protein